MVGGDCAVLGDVFFLFFRIIFALALHHGLTQGTSHRLGSTRADALGGIISLVGFLNEGKGSRSLTLLALRSSYQILN